MNKNFKNVVAVKRKKKSHTLINRKEKNQNRNNIKTFEKLKFDTVGVGVPDDPNIFKILVLTKLIFLVKLKCNIKVNFIKFKRRREKR